MTIYSHTVSYEILSYPLDILGIDLPGGTAMNGNGDETNKGKH